MAEAMANIGIGHAKREAAESRAAEAVSKVVAAEAKVKAAHAKAIELQRGIDALRRELASSEASLFSGRVIFDRHCTYRLRCDP